MANMINVLLRKHVPSAETRIGGSLLSSAACVDMIFKGGVGGGINANSVCLDLMNFNLACSY